MTAFTEETALERKQKKEANKQRQHRQDLLNKAVTNLMQTDEGREYLWWLLEITRAYGSNPYRTSATDTAFLCGEQNIGQQILAHIMKSHPVGFTNLLLEKHNERNSRNKLSANDPYAESEPDEPASAAEPAEYK